MFAIDFEAGMRLVYDELGGAIPQLMREMAIYFVQFRPVGPASLYVRLISFLRSAGVDRRVLLSTLNYECALDYAIAQSGLGIAYFADGSDGELPLWKLHGSCNMFSAGVQAGAGISYGPGVTWEGGIRALPTADAVVQHCLVETGLAPVMSLYMEGKPLNVSPSAIRQLHDLWSEFVRTATRIYCIGVRPLPADTHIWEPLFHSNAHLLFVGDRAAFDIWSVGRRAPSQYLTSRFAAAFDSILGGLTGP
ncbi:MAG: hypothetical protein HYX65_08830 [Gemmatimonadetes bacterium]|nr:hypothetical protein [Gemmatimonadota bacterium]